MPAQSEVPIDDRHATHPHLARVPGTDAVRVVVIGAGVSGLAAAYDLVRERPDWEVVVLEQSQRVGGLISTHRTDGYVIEEGPDSILTEKPAALELARELGLEAEIINTNTENRGAHIVTRGELERIPVGFSMMTTTDALSLWRSPILSLWGKLRLACEPLIPSSQEPDESIAEFVVRRCGREVLDRLAQPLMSGIYGSDAAALSLAATMPRFQQWEQESGSVFAGLRKNLQSKAQAASGARYAMFISFARGMQTLTDALATKLGAHIRKGCRVDSIQRTENGFSINLDPSATDPEPISADSVIMCTAAYRAADMLESLDPTLSTSLRGIPYTSSATASYAWPKDAIVRPLDSFGFVVPKIEQRSILASTWSSVKWAGRAPEGHVLIRVFFGGDTGQELLAQSDDELSRIGIQELDALIGVKSEPELSWFTRQTAAMPQYRVGHLALVARIRQQEARIPGLRLAGNAYDGVGIPDAVRSGRSAAQSLIRSSSSRGMRGAVA